MWPWAMLVGYALGSIPVAWLVVKAMTGLDLRQVGSGNVGAANALRSTRWLAGILVALLDVAKGSAAVGLVTLLDGGSGSRVVAGLGAILGHVFPVWLRFRGGKGVATAAGVFAVLAPLATLVAAVVFAIVAATTKVVSLASLTATAALVGAAWGLGAPDGVLALAGAVAIMVVARHQANLVRLARGTEPRLGAPRGGRRREGGA